MNETAVASDEATSEGVAREGIPGREPRPPILRARFTKARVVYLQRFTMEQVRTRFCWGVLAELLRRRTLYGYGKGVFLFLVFLVAR